MDRDERDPIFSGELGKDSLCFDSCDRFLDNCQGCDKLAQFCGGGEEAV